MIQIIQLKALKKTSTILIAVLVLTAIIGLKTKVADAHCNAMDGPLIAAARKSLETKDVTHVLPYVPKRMESELIEIFKKTLSARDDGEDARKVADLYFFENAVRLHRVAEGSGFKGLIPSGTDFGPALPVAAKAIKTGSVDELKEVMKELVAEAIEERFNKLQEIKAQVKGDGVEAAREKISANLQFQLYIDHLYKQMTADAFTGLYN